MGFLSGNAVVSLCILVFAMYGSAATADETSCPLTKPPSAPFKGPYPPPHGQYWFGGEPLAFKLEKDGLWRSHGAKKNYEGSLVVYSDKYAGALVKVPALEVTGKSLPGESAGLTVRVSNHYIGGFGWMMLAKVQFPAAGCWEVTVAYKGSTETFVTLVQGS